MQPTGTNQQGQGQIQTAMQPVMRKINTSSPKNLALPIMAVVIVLVGVGTGWFLAGNRLGGSSNKVAPGATVSPKEAGIDDTEAFPDTAEGILKKGGIDGEGTHYLDRNAGESKYVYLFSTVIDLEGFVGKRVTVQGATQAAKKAPWLMDVGKIKVIE